MKHVTDGTTLADGALALAGAVERILLQRDERRDGGPLQLSDEQLLDNLLAAYDRYVRPHRPTVERQLPRPAVSG